MESAVESVVETPWKISLRHTAAKTEGSYSPGFRRTFRRTFRAPCERPPEPTLSSLCGALPPLPAPTHFSTPSLRFDLYFQWKQNFLLGNRKFK